MSPAGRRLPFALWPCLWSTTLAAQDAAPIATAMQQLLATPHLADARIGVVVDDLASGRRLCEHDAAKGFMTASNMKLLTAAAALQALGPAFTFATTLEAGGELKDGVLTGDLVLVGDGDPSFGHAGGSDPIATLAPFVDAVQQLGVRRLDGRVVGVDDVQDDQALGEGWQWDYLHEDYAAPFGGLCFAENVATVFVRGGGSEGAPPVLRLVPDVGQCRVVGSLRCGPAGSKTEVQVRRQPGTAVVTIGGSVAADAPEQPVVVSVENPTRYAALALRAALVARGIEVRGPAVDADDIGGLPVSARRRLYEHRSRPLGDLLQRLLKDSQNLWAEQLWRTVARKAVAASDQAACEGAVGRALAGLGVEPSGLVLADGSGLSRRNLVQPRQIAALLAALHRGPQRDVFVGALPIAGVDGTLQKRMAAGPARGHVFAKTGFIGRVACLSGYIARPEAAQAPLAFCVLLNNFTCTTDEAKAAIDAFVQDLAAAAGWPRE